MLKIHHFLFAADASGKFNAGTTGDAGNYEVVCSSNTINTYESPTSSDIPHIYEVLEDTSTKTSDTC